jgi:streptogramin lyase
MRPDRKLTFTAWLASILVCGAVTDNPAVLASGQLSANATVTGQPASLTEVPVPTPNAAPTDLTIALDGSLWFTEKNANKVARLTSAGVFTEYAVPTASSAPEWITAAPSGYVWFTERYGRKIGRIHYSGGPVAEFAVPGTGAFATAITTDASGKVWIALNQQPNVARIGSISSTGVITLLPTGASQTMITSLVKGPDGNLWATQVSSYWGDSVARITTAGWGTFTNYRLANRSAGPQHITVGPDHNLWFTEANAAKIGRITTAGSIVEYALPSGARPQRIAAGPDGNLWFTERYPDQIGQITTAGFVSEYPIPTPSSQPMGIVSDGAAEVSFAEQAANQIGLIGWPF